MIDDDSIEPNDTAAALLRKLEDGTFMNHAGAEVQRLLAHLRATAAKKAAQVTGEITIKIKIPVGKDGYALPTAEIKTKAPQMKREETMVFIDEDGDLMARPVEKQIPLRGVESPANNPAAPKSKAV